MKAAIGQRINLEAIVCSASVIARDRHLLLPHVSVPDIRYIDWAELQRRGFKGVVFDKDNTLTAPYSLRLWGPNASSIEQCKSVFGHNIAVFSNSAGSVWLKLLNLKVIGLFMARECNTFGIVYVFVELVLQGYWNMTMMVRKRKHSSGQSG